MRSIERRSYLRIADAAVSLHVPVSEEQIKQASPEQLAGCEPHFSLRRDLYRLELEARELQREIAQQDRKLGSLIHNYNQRLEIISTIVRDHDPGLPDNVIDLSAAGVSYLSRDLFAAGDLLALKIVFTDTSLAIASLGMVRYCLLGDEDQNRLGVQFISLDGTTEALLERHITSLQSAERRRRLHNS